MSSQILYTIFHPLFSVPRPIRSPLHAARYSLFATRYTLYALRYSLFATCYTLYALRYSLFAIRSPLYAARYMLYAIRNTQYAIRDYYAKQTQFTEVQYERNPFINKGI